MTVTRTQTQTWTKTETATAKATPTVCLANQIGFGWDTLVPQEGSKANMRVSNDASQAYAGNSFLAISVPQNTNTYPIVFYNNDVRISTADSYTHKMTVKADKSCSITVDAKNAETGVQLLHNSTLVSNNWSSSTFTFPTKDTGVLSFTYGISCGGTSANFGVDAISLQMGSTTVFA